jgi:hypothetical protein
MDELGTQSFIENLTLDLNNQLEMKEGPTNPTEPLAVDLAPRA